MSPTFFWLVSACLLGALVVQGVLLRVLHRRHLEALRMKHQQVRAKLSADLEQMSLRVLQLQREPAPVAASLPEVRHEPPIARPERPTVAARQALERELDDAYHSRAARPSDGFADTQVLAHESQEESLLLP